MSRPSVPTLAFVVLAVASHGCAPHAVSDPRPGEVAATTVASSPPEPAPSTRAASGIYSPEATACSVATDCERVPLRAESELNGGACCSVCAGYAAVNHAYQARQAACDPLKRGACPVSCTEGRPPPVACEAGQCVLTYPPLRATCATDGDCVVVPSLQTGAPAGGCRIVCGHYVAGNREWDAWAASLWENTSVTGVCAAGCVDPMLPAAECVAGQCGIRAPSAVRVIRVDLRGPTATAGLTAAEITSVVTASQAQLTACKERSRSIAPIGYAGFQVHFVIGADGRATKIDAGELAYHVPDIAACLVSVIGGLQFARPTGGGSVAVEYPMGAAFEAR
ncbi:MAG: hypothetical protein ABJE95_13420 [Byssovorax sp.]